MGILFTAEVGKVLTRLLGNYLTEALGKVLDIYSIALRKETLMATRKAIVVRVVAVLAKFFGHKYVAS